MFNISRPTAAQSDEVASPDLCPNTFNQIITSCIGDTAPLYWGGFWSTGVTNYSVTNNEFPTNPFEPVNLIGGAISDGIVGQTVSSTPSQVEEYQLVWKVYPRDAGTASVTDSAGGPGAVVVSTASTNSASTDSAPQGANIATNTETDTGGNTVTNTITGTASVTDSTGGLSAGSLSTASTDSAHQETKITIDIGIGNTATNITTGVGSDSATLTSSGTNIGPTGGATVTDSGNLVSTGSSTLDGGGGTTAAPQQPVAPTSADTAIPSADTEVIAIVSSQAVSELFSSYINPSLTALASTLTTTSTDAQGSPFTMVIGPGGIAWTPVAHSTGSPDLQPPMDPPVNPNGISGVPTITATATICASSGASAAGVLIGAATATDSALLGAAFGGTNTITTLTAGNLDIIYHKETFPNLVGIPRPTTITTPVVETNRDGSHWTISAVIIIVHTDGSWWNGGIGGFGLKGPRCIW